VDGPQDRDWDALATEYITGSIGYRKMAEKHDIPFRTIACRALREHWADRKRAHRESVVNTATRKIAKKRGSEQANRLMKLQSAAVDMGAVIAKVFEDAQQFHRFLVMVKTEDTLDTVERVFDKVDTKAIKDLTGAMKDLAYVLRDIYEIPGLKEKTKAAEAAAEDSGAGIIVLAEADQESEVDADAGQE
jgi:hypothetical protein